MYYIGLDIGGTKCAASLGLVENGEIRLLQREEVPTQRDPKITLGNLAGAIEKYKKEVPVYALGISCGGPLDGKKGVIMTPPNLPGWHYFPIVDYVYEQFGLRSKLENDANACALAEWKFGAGTGTENMIFLTFGTGLGAGLILDGKLYAGTNGNAGEAGHIRLSQNGPIGYGKRGSFEGFCSGGGISRLAGIMAEKSKLDTPARAESLQGITTKKLSEYARAGDAFAKRVFAKSGSMLGKGLSVLVDLFNPERIVIGGVFMRSGDLLIPTMGTALRKEALAESMQVCEIVPAKLSENIGDIAALSVATGV